MFTENQLELIKNTLKIVARSGCISKGSLFKLINSEKPLGMEQYQFEKFLTFALRDGTLPGYRIKQGRGGGICKSESSSSIIYDGLDIPIHHNNIKIISLLIKLSKESPTGKITFNRKSYDPPTSILLSDLIKEIKCLN